MYDINRQIICLRFHTKSCTLKSRKRLSNITWADSSVTRNRLSSFYRTAEKFGVFIPDAYIKEAAYRSTREAQIATEELLKLVEVPTCIFYPDDFASFGGINAIKTRGLRIPEDISVVGYDGIQIGRHIEPQLTTLRQDTKKIGCMAAKTLIALIEKPKTTLTNMVMIEGTVYPGKTVSKLF